MSIEQYITAEIPVLAPSDTGAEAIERMQEFLVSELPLVSGQEYRALIREEDIREQQAEDKPVSVLQSLYARPVAYARMHPYEAAVLMAEQDLSVLPVLDENHKYLGTVMRSELLNFFCDNSGLTQSGGIIILSMQPLNYSLSEIARICENNDVVILNTQIFSAPGQDIMDVVLKTNKKELQVLQASFERYGYTVKEIYGETSAHADLTDRYRLLMNYINM